MIRIFQILLISLLSVKVSCLTDPTRIRFDYLTVDEGLSQGIIQDIFQDSRGFIWIATRDGLNRYDGLNIEIFRHERNDPNSLAANLIYCIREDSSGFLWIGSSGLNRLDPVTGEMVRIPVNPNVEGAFRGGRIYDIAIDHDKTIWFASSNGLIHYFPQTNKFKTYTQDISSKGMLGTNTIYGVTIAEDKSIYISADTDPIYEFNRLTETFTPIHYKESYLGQNYFKKVHISPDGLLYITSENAGLDIYNPLTKTSQLKDNNNSGLNALTIKSILFLSNNEIWLGTDGGGINVFHPVTDTYEYIKFDAKNEKTLNGNAIYKILQDRHQNIWVGHFGTGVSIWKKNKEKFTSYKNNPLNPLSLNKEIVCSIFEDSKGRIWIGHDGGGLSLFDEHSASFEHFRRKAGDPASLGTDVILAIREIPSGDLLLGTYAGGMMVFDPNTKKVKKTYKTVSGMPSDHIWSIHIDSQGRYWLLTLRGGVSLFDPDRETFRNFSSDGINPGICSNDLITMAEAPDGKLWFGTDNSGICILDPQQLSLIKTYVRDEKNLNTLSDNSVRSIVFLGDYAWIATNGGGLNRIDLRTDSFKVYSMQEGLSSNALMGILADHDSSLWISSTRGLMKFDPNTEEVILYDKSHGIQGNEFKYNAQYLLSDGRMMFGGVNGLTVFHPDSIKRSRIIPFVVLTDFKIFNTSVIPGERGSPLKENIDYASSITLKYDQRVFTFRFASLDYNSPESNKFAYMLEGFDEDWIEAGTTNSVTYTNLDPGRYTFLLKGSNSDGVWNDSPRSIKIRIRPPWYKTKIAFAGFLIILLASVRFLYLRQRQKRALLDNQLLQQKIDKAQMQLESKIAEVEKQKEELKQRDEAGKETKFQTEGIARFSDIIAKNRRNLQDLSNTVISELTQYVGGMAGVIFVIEERDKAQPWLKIAGEYQFSSDNNDQRCIAPGVGYIGTCYVEKQTIHINNLPSGHTVLRSGLGEISLKSAVIVPMVNDNLAVGVIEIGSLETLSNYKITFIEKIAETLASVITITKAHERNDQILLESKKLSEAQSLKEEAMQLQIEEMQKELKSAREQINRLPLQ